MNAVGRIVDARAKRANRLLGYKATFIDRGATTVDVVTGAQSTQQATCKVVIRPWPFTARELSDRSSAGLVQVDARWTMRVVYAGEVEPGDRIDVKGMVYEVVPSGATQDELGVEWTILTRRLK